MWLKIALYLPEPFRTGITAYVHAYRDERRTLEAGKSPKYWLPFFPYRKYLNERQYAAHIERFVQK